MRDKDNECERRLSGGAIFICWWGVERSKRAARAFKDAMPHLQRIDTLEGGTIKMNENFKTDEELKRRLDGYSHIYLIYDRGSEKRETEYLDAAEARLRRCGLAYNVVDTDMLASCINEAGRDPNEYFNY